MKYLLLFFIFSFHLLASPNQKVTLQLNWLHQFQFAGYYVAKEKGFYKDAGIDVEIKEFHYGLDIPTAIENKTVDFAIGRSSILIDKANGKDIVALAAIFQHSPLMLLVTQSDISTVEDLKNKNIMITQSAKDAASIVAMLNSKRIKLTDINIQKHSFNVNDLIDGKTDAMASYTSNEPLVLESKNIPYKIFHPKDYGFEFYSDILFTSSKFIKKNPILTKKFYDATEKGWKYAFDNIGKTAQIIHKKYNSQNKSLIQLVSEGEALKKIVHHPNTTIIGCLDKYRLQKIVDIYKVLGLVHKDINLDEFIYKHNKHQTLTFNLTHNQMWLYIVLGILVFAGLISILFYLIIKRKWLLTKYELEKEILLKTEKLKKQSYTDFLTKAKNRKAYSEKIEEHLSLYQRHKTPFSLVLFDIDDFKNVNDTYGHIVGDTVLINLVKIVKSCIRKNDFLFRVGGEEFVVIFSSTPLEEAKIVSEHIRKKVEKELSTIKNETITISLGLSEVNNHDDAVSIYNRADKLMYHSKKSGKNILSY